MADKNEIIGYHTVGQEVGKPSQNATQPCTEAEGCVHDDLPKG